MSEGVALVVGGELWGTEVVLHLVHTQTHDSGIVVLKGDLDLMGKLAGLLGLNGDSGNHENLSSETSIDFTMPANSRAFVLGTQLGSVRLEYVNGSLQEGKTGQAFFLKTSIGSILAAIPGFDESWIKGELELGFSSGFSFRTTVKDGNLSFEPVQNGLYLSAQLEVNNLKTEFIPEKNDPQLPADSEASDKKQELAVNRSFGGVKLHNLVYSLENGKLLVLLQAGLQLGPLTLDFIDLGTEIDLPKLLADPLDAFSFRLYGLALNFEKEALQIAGLFAKNPKKDEYSGGVIIRTKSFSISGFGVYSKEADYHSLFGFLCLNANIGGNPAFYVTGISMCFGYNREISIPSIDRISEFPLVRFAMDTGSAPRFDNPEKAENPLVIFNRNIGPSIPPKKGAFFFGIGVKFNTYKVLDTVALLILSVGEDLEFHLLGLSRLALPAGTTGRPLVFVEMSMRASYSVAKGFLQIEGQLTESSYLFSTDVKLTGGFAFYSWFKDQGEAKAGDFLITAGGYHPDFVKPDHYPEVPRIGFEWRVGSSLFVSGKMYVALTPAAIMAGAAFDAVWNSGNLSAQFSFLADFIIRWKPFQYDAQIGIGIRASFSINTWWISKSFSLDLSANLHVWGPDFSGTADLHARVCGIGVSYSIAFGNAEKQSPTISWSSFKTDFLPPAEQIIQYSVTEGLIEEWKNPETGEQLFLVNPGEISVSVDSMIPITSMEKGPDSLRLTHSSFSIPTIGKSGIKTTLILSLKDANGTDRLENFHLVPKEKNLPRAVWNDSMETDPLSGNATIPMTTSIRIMPKPVKKARSADRIPLITLASNSADAPLPGRSKKTKPTEYADFLLLPDDYPADDFPQIRMEEMTAYLDEYAVTDEKPIPGDHEDN